MSEVQEAESIESIMEKYKGEWVAVKVTKRKENEIERREETIRDYA